MLPDYLLAYMFFLFMYCKRIQQSIPYKLQPVLAYYLSYIGSIFYKYPTNNQIEICAKVGLSIIFLLSTHYIFVFSLSAFLLFPFDSQHLKNTQGL